MSPIMSEFNGVSAILTGSYGQPYTFQRVTTRSPATGEAVVRLDFSGVCHGDVYMRDGGGPAPAKPRRPLIGGHEGVGKVVALGPGDETGFKIGQCVGIAWRSFVCGQCQACCSGSPNFCEHQTVTGAERDGTFSRYITFPVEHLIPIPDKLGSSPAVCPILCAGLTAYSALQKMKPIAGKWCAIVGGAGGVGHLAIQYAKVAFGMKVIVIDGGNNKAEFCKRLGADVFVDYINMGKELPATVRFETDGGADYILVLSPVQSAYKLGIPIDRESSLSHSYISDAGEYARFGARIMAIGIANCSFPLRPILRKSLLIQSNQTGTKEDMAKVLELSARGVVHSEIDILKMRDLNLGLDRVMKGEVRGKLVVEISD